MARLATDLARFLRGLARLDLFRQRLLVRPHSWGLRILGKLVCFRGIGLASCLRSILGRFVRVRVSSAGPKPLEDGAPALRETVIVRKGHGPILAAAPSLVKHSPCFT